MISSRGALRRQAKVRSVEAREAQEGKLETKPDQSSLRSVAFQRGRVPEAPDWKIYGVGKKN